MPAHSGPGGAHRGGDAVAECVSHARPPSHLRSTFASRACAFSSGVVRVTAGRPGSGCLRPSCRGRGTSAPAGATPSTGARGSRKVAVPTWTASAPACRSSTASWPDCTPPTPTIAVSGNAARHSQTARTATGCTGAPESPPPPAPRTGRPVSVSRASPSSVFTSVSPSAPPSSAPVAISTTSGTLGLSLAQRGRPHLVAAMTRAVASAEWANMRDRSSTFGQLTLTSSAAMQRPGSVFAAAATSSAARS